MSAFLKIDRCSRCRRDLAWEWVPAVTLRGRPLAGTGLWRSLLVDGLCSACAEGDQRQREREHLVHQRRAQFIQVVGGPRPYREFTLERFHVAPGNQAAFEVCRSFDASRDNVYLWGKTWTGKTHLAVATLRRCMARGVSIERITTLQLIRRLRMKAPDDEEETLQRLVRTQALVLENLGDGSSTPYARQLLEEILDGRRCRDRAGLLVTSRYSLEALARNPGEQSLAARLAAMCRVLEVRGVTLRSAKWPGPITAAPMRADGSAQEQTP